MKISLSPEDLTTYTLRQINTFFPDKEISAATLRPLVDEALERAEVCFGGIRRNHYTMDGLVHFNHLYTDQYATYLYLLSNTAFKHGHAPELASKCYALNKALHCLEINYEAALPEVFFLVHPVATVIGKGTYGNFLTVYQGCTIGSNIGGGYPETGEGVVLFGGSRLIGNARVGNNCMISAGTTVMNDKIPDNTVTFMENGILKSKPTTRNVIEYIFSDMAS
jgi:serine O-acetyltransferase